MASNPISTLPAAQTVSWTGRSSIASSADGYLELKDSAGTAFTGLRFGGTSSSYPMLKRSSATLQARLADDSGYAALSVGNLTAGDATNQLITLDTVTSGSPTMTGARIRLSTTEAPTEFYDIYTGEDANNTSTQAMYIVPPTGAHRLFFGRSGKTFLLDMQYVTSIENHPSFATTDAHTWGGLSSNCTGRQLGSLTIDGESVNTVYNVSSNGSKTAHHFLAVSGAWTNPTATSIRATITSDRNFFLWNTYTSSTNYERGVFGWESNVLKIGTQKAASGTARDMSLVTNNTQRMKIDASGGVFLYGLPTSDPGVSGQLYTSSGTLKVSP